MTTTCTETVPQTWNDEIDTPFFTITARIFAPDFCYGASVLLASYDDDAVSQSDSSFTSDVVVSVPAKSVLA